MTVRSSLAINFKVCCTHLVWVSYIDVLAATEVQQAVTSYLNPTPQQVIWLGLSPSLPSSLPTPIHPSLPHPYPSPQCYEAFFIP